MSKVIIELPVNKIGIGSYVARLDRPWSETPFLFQGFTIRESSELETLRRLCKVAFVEIDAEDPKEPARELRQSSNGARPEVKVDPLAVLTRDPFAYTGQVPVRDIVPLHTELVTATTTYNEAKRSVTSVFDRLRHGGSLDVPHLEAAVGSIVDSVVRNRDAVSWLASMKTKDDYLYSHSLASAVWALAFGRHLGLDKDALRTLGTGAMLLDIGKIKLPTDLLRKSTKPTAQEWQQLHEHVALGVKIVSASPSVDSGVVDMISTHHERIDGSGYPNKLKGNDIPLLGRIASIVDCYDAMTSERSYAKAKSAYDAVRDLKQLARQSLPADLVELFIQAVGVFPTGTLVELNTGEVGVVITQNRFRRLRPEVMLILDADKSVRSEFLTVDLLTCDQNSNAGQPGLWITKGLPKEAYGIDPIEYFL